jgi:WD40 repeat protein
LHTYRGHTGPLYAVTANNGQLMDDTLIYSAGMEGVIRIWKLPKIEKHPFPTTDGQNHCVGVFSSHKDVVWQLLFHPEDNILLSVSADGSVKMWKSFDLVESRNFESIE